MVKHNSEPAWAKPLPGKTPRSMVADMIGKAVDVPASVFNVDDPGLVYRGTVTGPDNSHKNAAIVKLKGDKRRFYFPLGQVREWFEATQLCHAASEESAEEQEQPEPTTSDQSDQFAAEILMSLHQDQTGGSAHKQECYNQHAAKAASMQAESTQTTANAMPPQVNSVQRPPMYTAEATAAAVKAAFDMGFRLALNLQSGAGIIPMQF